MDNVVLERSVQRLESIFNTLLLQLDDFPIIKMNGYSPSWMNIKVPWYKSREGNKSGFVITCPRDLDINSYLCEICLCDSNGALYSLSCEIQRVKNLDQLLHEFYKCYLLFFCVSQIPRNFFCFSLRNAQKRRPPMRLQSLSAMQLTTKNYGEWRHIIY